MSNDLIVPPGNGDLFERVVSILEQARTNVVRAVNHNTLIAYWLIGREIVEEVQGGKRAEYGKEVLADLSTKLTEKYGSGYSVTTLKYFRTFYHVYADRNLEIGHPLGDQLGSNEKSRPSGDQLAKTVNRYPFYPHLSWSHYRALMRVNKPKAREFYEREAAECGWTKAQLERQIHTSYYERIISNQGPEGLLSANRERLPGERIAPVDTLKAPYVLEFLNLPESAKLHESRFEEAIIDNLQAFLLELGKGFAFVARQKRMQFDDDSFYIDLVFYNYILKCFLLIDLKMGELAHQDVGQMDSYVRMFDECHVASDDNPTIGLILCAKKNESIAKYSVLKESKQIFASKYIAYLPTVEELEAEIMREQRLIRQLLEARDEAKEQE